MTELTHASFFSGAGGTDIGLERAGARTVSVSEIEPYACALLAERFPGVPNLGDITKINAEDVPDAYLWSGGFPCQDLSIAGKRRGFGGERSVLAFAFLDLVEQRRPPALLLENVPGLLTSHRGRDLFALTSRLAELGYGWAFRILDARYFGVPQRRRRVFILALRSDPDDPSGRIAAERAAEVLAVGHRCGWHPPAGIPARADAPNGAGDGAALAGAVLAREGRGIGHNYPEDHIVGTLTGPSPNRGWPSLENATDGYLVGALSARPYDDRGHENGQIIGPVRAGGHGDPGIGRDGDEERLAPVSAPPPDAAGVRAADGLAGRLDDRAELAPTLRVGAASIDRGGPGDTVPVPIVIAMRGREEGNVPELSADGMVPALRGPGGGSSHSLVAPPAAFVKRQRAASPTDPESWGEAEVAPTLNSFDGGDGRATALVVGSLLGGGSGGQRTTDFNTPLVAAAEPEDDPLLPLGLDSHRYRCCGNGVVAPQAEWLGRRIAAGMRLCMTPYKNRSRQGSIV